MGIKRNPYLRHIDSYKDDSKAFYSLTRTIGLREDQVDPIYLTTDGKLVANGFIDKNDNLELYLDENYDVNYKRKVDIFTDEIYQIDNKVSYQKQGKVSEAIRGDFTYYENQIQFYSDKDSLKYAYLNGTTKRLVDSNSEGPFCFTFTHENGAKYPVPHIKALGFQLTIMMFI